MHKKPAFGVGLIMARTWLKGCTSYTDQPFNLCTFLNADNIRFLVETNVYFDVQKYCMSESVHCYKSSSGRLDIEC